MFNFTREEATTMLKNELEIEGRAETRYVSNGSSIACVRIKWLSKDRIYILGVHSLAGSTLYFLYRHLESEKEARNKPVLLVEKAPLNMGRSYYVVDNNKPSIALYLEVCDTLSGLALH